MARKFEYRGDEERVLKRIQQSERLWEWQARKRQESADRQRNNIPPHHEQENMLTLIAHHEEGRKALLLVRPEHFDGDYRTIAERLFAYWDRYDRPPRDHAFDLLADIIDDPDDKRRNTYRKILVSMLQLSESLNPQYILDEVDRFITGHRLRVAITLSAQAVTSGDYDEALRVTREMMAQATAPVVSGPGLVSADQFPQRPVEWFRTPFVPHDMVSLLTGEKGLGKTTMILNWAASLSRQDESTIYLTKEGSPTLTINPLMVAAGGDVKKLLVYGVPEAKGGHYHRPPDRLGKNELAKLESEIIARNEAGEQIGLVAIEPINSFVDAVKANSDAGMRELLDRLMLIADRHKLMVIGTTHWNKNRELRVRDRLLGSVGILNAARSVNVLVNDPEEQGGRLLVNLIGNERDPTVPNARGYAIRSHNGVRVIKWSPRSDMVVLDEEQLDAMTMRKVESKKPGRPRKIDEACRLLQEWLKDGPVLREEILALAKDAEIGQRTLMQAKNICMVESEWRGRNSYWKL